MILTGAKIKQEVLEGNIKITPFDEKLLNPNSYDFRLGNMLKMYQEKLLDPKKKNETQTIEIPPEGYLLEPDRLYLGHTVEVFHNDKYVPIIHGKSSTGRLGLFVHITADLIDIGYRGVFTLMMHVVQPVRVYPHMRIGQVSFWMVYGDIQLYSGKYQHSIEAAASQVYKDFE